MLTTALYGPAVPADKQSVADVVSTTGDPARTRLLPWFATARVQYPPRQATLLVIKDSATMEVWTGPETQPAFIRRYDIKAISGKPGTRLYDDDVQVPEGIYNIDKFDPNSENHLALRISYPNDFDLARAVADGRNPPSPGIFLHGRSTAIEGTDPDAAIIGIDLGNEVIEELFLLAADTGKRSVKVVIAPSDPRVAPLHVPASPAWLATLYRDITDQFSKFPRPAQ